MQRSLLKMGGSSLAITLPSKWIKDHGVSASEHVEVRGTGNNLVVSTTKRAKSSITVDISDFNSSLIFRHLNALYCGGHDAIVLKFKNTKTRDFRSGKLRAVSDIVYSAVDDLIGFDVSNQSEHEISVRAFSTNAEPMVKQTLRHLFHLVQSLIRDCTEYMLNQNREMLQSIRVRDRRVNRYSFLCLRLLNQFGSPNPANTPVLYSVVQNLEYISDQIGGLANDYLKSGQAHKKLFPLIDIAAESVSLYEKLFYTDNRQLFIKYYDLREDFVNRTGQSMTPTEIGLAHRLERIMSAVGALIDRKIELVD